MSKVFIVLVDTTDFDPAYEIHSVHSTKEKALAISAEVYSSEHPAYVEEWEVL